MSRSGEAKTAQGYCKTTPMRCATCAWLRWETVRGKRGTEQSNFECGVGRFPARLYGWCPGHRPGQGREKEKPRRGGA